MGSGDLGPVDGGGDEGNRGQGARAVPSAPPCAHGARGGPRAQGAVAPDRPRPRGGASARPQGLKIFPLAIVVQAKLGSAKTTIRKGSASRRISAGARGGRRPELRRACRY